MIDLLIIILFIAALVSGYKKGFITQLLNLVGLLVALIVAYIYYKPFAEKIVLWVPYPAVTENTALKFANDALDLNLTFYQLLAFAIIFFVIKIVLSILFSIFDFLKDIPVLGVFNRFLGSLLGFVQCYIMLFIILYVLALLPIDSIQKYVESSILTKVILEFTPILSSLFQKMWFVYLQ
ncbi:MULTISPECIES: CvpA family protein [Kurthia]|uniref:CvpA family protein n=1 Tax=Kurthia TaxID=1649 RepID=UPI001143163F|nr:CvpA family protein [Kurthia gibsonii]GED20244.1 colicin V production protein CvpA [Kurthia gibsonii]